MTDQAAFETRLTNDLAVEQGFSGRENPGRRIRRGGRKVLNPQTVRGGQRDNDDPSR